MAPSVSGKSEDVLALIGKKNYARAIEVLRVQLQTRYADDRIRLQLADVLTLTGKGREAVTVLLPLADHYAHEGFAAKAISVLKRIQKIDPGRRDVELRLAELIEAKQRGAAVVSLPQSSGPEIGMEEIGLELPIASISVAVEPSSAAVVEAPTPIVAAVEAEAGPELAIPMLAPTGLTFDLEAPSEGTPAAQTAHELDDNDLLYLDDALVEEPVGARAVAEDPGKGGEATIAVSDEQFVDELLGLVDAALAPMPSGAELAASTPGETGPGKAQMVVSPLFNDLSVDELVAVIGGLRLLAFTRGDVIVRQGDTGDSLYMLTSGRVRAFKRNSAGKQVPVADLDEGAFFGEVSILSRGPRTATVAALTRCEMLELDRGTLDSITARHPRVREVMEEFAKARVGAAPQ